MNVFTLFLLATVERGNDFDFDAFLNSLGINLEGENPDIVSFSSPRPHSGSWTCNVCFCHINLDELDSIVDYAEAKGEAIEKGGRWLEERRPALLAVQERMNYTLYIEMFLSNRYGLWFPPAFARTCADLNITIDLDLYAN